MRLKVLHILVSLLLATALTNHIWVELIDNANDVIANVEAEEKEKESEEEQLREGRLAESKFENVDFVFVAGDHLPSLHNGASGYVKCGNSFRPLLQKNRPKLVILHQQLKIHC